MNVIERIEQAPACQVINLTETEKNIYNGAGWRLAQFINGKLINLFDPAEVEYNSDAQTMADVALNDSINWIKHLDGEAWLVTCSGYQLCNPRRITLTDAAAVSALARAIGEAVQID